MRYLLRSLLIALALVAVGLADRAAAQPYHIDAGEAVVSFGGGFTSNGSLIVLGQPLTGRMNSPFYTIDVGLLLTLPPPYEQDVSNAVVWDTTLGCCSCWSACSALCTPNNCGTPGVHWNPQIVPDNDDNLRYSAFINSPSAIVSLNINPTLSRLQLDTGAQVEMNHLAGATARSITFDGTIAGNAINKGVIRVRASAAAVTRTLNIISMNVDQQGSGGGGRLEAKTASPTGQSATLVISNSSVNGGTIVADGAGALVQLLNTSVGGGTDLANGVFQAINGGQFDVQTQVTGTGTYLASAGTIKMQPGFGGNALHGESLTIEEGGSLELNLSGATAFTATFSGDVVVDGSPPGWGNSPPVLRAGPNGRLTSTSISLTENAGVDLHGGSLITLSGNWNNFANVVGEFNSGMGSMQMNAAGGGPLQTFELAGQDRGFSEDGFEENFALLSLEIGPNRMIRFEDTFSNSPPPPEGCGETLYVQELVFGEGSQITADCGKVYYKTSDPEAGGIPQSVTFLNGGFIAYIGTPGNINGDLTPQGADIVNIADMTLFIEVLQSGMQLNPDAFFRSDLNHDGVVNGRDIQLFVNAML